jgi:hypothetical protein
VPQMTPPYNPLPPLCRRRRRQHAQPRCGGACAFGPIGPPIAGRRDAVTARSGKAPGETRTPAPLSPWRIQAAGGTATPFSISQCPSLPLLPAVTPSATPPPPLPRRAYSLMRLKGSVAPWRKFISGAPPPPTHPPTPRRPPQPPPPPPPPPRGLIAPRWQTTAVHTRIHSCTRPHAAAPTRLRRPAAARAAGGTGRRVSAAIQRRRGTCSATCPPLRGEAGC